MKKLIALFLLTAGLAQAQSTIKLFEALQAAEIEDVIEGKVTTTKSIGGLTCTKDQEQNVECSMDLFTKNAPLLYENLNVYETETNNGSETGLRETTKQVDNLMCTKTTIVSSGEVYFANCDLLKF